MSTRIRYIQEAIISELKGDSTLTTALASSDEIREDEWPSPNWSFPCLRIAVNLLDPFSDGLCHLDEWLVTFSVFVFTETEVSGTIYEASSKECSDIMRRVVSALHGKRLTFSNGLVHETRVNVSGQNAPVPEPSPGGWRGEILCEMKVRDVS